MGQTIKSLTSFYLSVCLSVWLCVCHCSCGSNFYLILMKFCTVVWGPKSKQAFIGDQNLMTCYSVLAQLFVYSVYDFNNNNGKVWTSLSEVCGPIFQGSRDPWRQVIPKSQSHDTKFLRLHMSVTVRGGRSKFTVYIKPCIASPLVTWQGRRLYIFKVFIDYISIFSINLTFGKTLLMQFCYFFLQNRHFWGYKCVSVQNSTWILLCWWIALHHHSWMHADIRLEYSFHGLNIYYMIGLLR